MSRIAEWWWAHEFVRIVVAVAVAFAWSVYVVQSFFRPFIKADKEHARRRYEREYREELEIEAALDELNRKLKSGELPK